jgi:NADH dehydrogenase
MKGAVTGVFSYSGRFIAEALLARGWEVVALGRRRPPPAESLAERVDFYPLVLDDEEALVTALSGCEVLFNTYWVRFEHGGATFAEAIEVVAASSMPRLALGCAALSISALAMPAQTHPSRISEARQRLKMRFDAPIARTRSCGRR